MWSWSTSSKPLRGAALAAAFGAAWIAGCTGPGGDGPAGSGFRAGQAHWERIAALDSLTDLVSLGRVAFFDARHGLALAKANGRTRLLRTADAGAHWQEALRESGPLDSAWILESVTAMDDSIGFLAASTAPDSSGLGRYAALRTGDAGATWRRIARDGDSDLALYDGGHYPLVLIDREPMGNVDFLLSTDAGATWKEWSPAGHPFGPENLLLTRPIHAYLGGKALTGTLGLNWVDLADGAVSPYREFPDSVEGPEIKPSLQDTSWMAFGGSAIRAGRVWPFLVQSRDGGRSWDTLATSRSANMRDIRLHGSYGLAYGDSYGETSQDTLAALWLSRDGGATWTESYAPAPPAAIVEAVWAAPGVCYGFDGTAVYRLRF
jgi:photosystem II stability/assembly factor-like uncharacterized protein